MTTPVKVLIVDDSEDDALLLIRELKRGGYDPFHARVDTAEDLQRALLEEPWDLILADYSMPRFSGPDALATVRAAGLDIPFIVVSGTLGEDAVVDAMRSGVQDYILKGRYVRLVPAVQRELRESVNRGERKKMEDQLMLSDRMASVGMLAAGVAHEINNPLAALIANLDYITQELTVSLHAHEAETAGPAINLAQVAREFAEPLQDAVVSAERIRQIVRDVRIFSRPNEERRGPVDVLVVLESTLRMAQNEIRHRARIVKDYGPVPAAFGNDARVGQVLLNLIVNAAQSIPEGHADSNEIRIITRTDAQGRAVIEVRDTGTGMSPETLKRIFDPFFTTKPVGIGTGLGLSICHRIITGLGGEIHADSQLGRGTTFSVSLLPAEGPMLQPQVATPVVALGARARILIVDDEVAIGRALRRTLREHDVALAASAREALDLIGSGRRFDIILCDVMMPEMTGIDLYTELGRSAPDQAARMTFTTGGMFTTSALDFLDTTQVQVIEKPIDMAKLRGLLQTKLAVPAAPR